MKWISVKNKLPKQMNSILMIDENKFISRGYYLGFDNKWNYECLSHSIDEISCGETPCKITHWMPLPEIPMMKECPQSPTGI